MTDASEPEELVCSCCGRGVSPRENVWRGEVPSPGDLGTGLCRDCGGDPDANDPKKRLGFAVRAFVDARIPLVVSRLSEKNRLRFLSLDDEAQAAFIFRCVEKGYIT